MLHPFESIETPCAFVVSAVSPPPTLLPWMPDWSSGPSSLRSLLASCSLSIGRVLAEHALLVHVTRDVSIDAAYLRVSFG